MDSPTHAPADCSAAPRHLSYATGEYTIQLDYAGLSTLEDEVYGVWQYLEDRGVVDDRAADLFEGLVSRLAYLRGFTGWGGVAGRYLTGDPAGQS